MASLYKIHAKTHILFKATFNFYKMHTSVYLNNSLILESFLKITLQVEAKALQDKLQKLKSLFSGMENMQSFKNNQFCKEILEWKVLERRQRINFPKDTADKIVVGTIHLQIDLLLVSYLFSQVIFGNSTCSNDCPIMQTRKAPFRHLTLDTYSELSLGLVS